MCELKTPFPVLFTVNWLLRIIVASDLELTNNHAKP